MKQVLIVSANTFEDPYPVYPLGASVVSSALRRVGYRARIHDLALDIGHEGLERVIKSFSPDYIGISVRNVDNVDSLSAEASWTGDSLRELIARLRTLSRAPIILGGPGFSLMPEALLEYCGADYGVAGPGEIALPELLKRLSVGEKCPQIVTAAKASFGTISPADWDDTVLPQYLKRGGVPGLHTKRGCSNACLYCNYPLLEGTKVRHRDPFEVVEDLRLARDRFGAKEFFFTDAVFNDSEGGYLHLAEVLAGAELGVRFGAYFQPSIIATGDLKLLKRAGLMAVEVGTDGGCDRTLEGLGKPHRMEDVFAFQEQFHAHQVPCAHFIIFGGPGETMESIEEGLANLDRLAGGCVFAFLGLRMYQGTGLFRLAVEEGLISAENPLLRPSFYFSTQLDVAWAESRLRRAFAGRRDRFFPPEEGNLRMRVLRRMGYSGLLWDTLQIFKSYKQKGGANELGAEHLPAHSCL